MFRGASLNTQPIEDNPTSDRRGPVVPWTWPMGTRSAAGVPGDGRRVGSENGEPGRSPVLGADRGIRRSWSWTRIPRRMRALAALPHVGPALAQRLVEARTERPFSSLED